MALNLIQSAGSKHEKIILTFSYSPSTRQPSTEYDWTSWSNPDGSHRRVYLYSQSRRPICCWLHWRGRHWGLPLLPGLDERAGRCWRGRVETLRRRRSTYKISSVNMVTCLTYRTSSMSGTWGLKSSSRYFRVSWLNACASEVILSIDFDNLRRRVTVHLSVSQEWITCGSKYTYHGRQPAAWNGRQSRSLIWWAPWT